MPALPVRRREAATQARQPWDPFREMADLQERMNQLIESVWGGVSGDQAFAPLADIEESEDAWIIDVDLPGVRKDDVNIEISDSELAITGEIRERERKGALRRRTRRTGQFEYRVMLPGDIDADRVEASLSDGVLTVRIPKPERSRPRRIAIKS